jgi:enolase
MSKIAHIQARQVLDSRGNPTVEADVYVNEGIMGRAIVPSGASTGSKEACELRDGGDAYGGKGVLKAVEHVQTTIRDAFVGKETNQSKLDQALIELDGTDNKERLGANAILAVSLAFAKADALARGMYLFDYIAELSRIPRTPLMPIPMCNVINGGKHAAHSTDIQEFMILPIGANSFHEGLQMVTEIFHALGQRLADRGYGTTVGDEGGYAPHVKNGNREALELLLLGVQSAGYVPGEDVTFAIDAAASEFNKSGDYVLETEGKTLTAHELLDYYELLAKEFPLVSIEDGLDENDWEGWQQMTERMGEFLQLVGDDFLVTNTLHLNRAIDTKAANAILIKPNQIGTLSETIDAVDTAHEAGWNAIVSHRSGETEDTTIAHIAVGLGTGEIKTGSLSRSDRVAKYNELLRIEEILGENAVYGFFDEEQDAS